MGAPKSAAEPWAPFAEPQGWGLTSVVDFRNAAKGRPDAKNQVVVRGLILRMANNWCVCFDPDLLRVAAVWQPGDENQPISAEGVAWKSYQNPKSKADGGINELPKPLGKIAFLAPVTPGAWSGQAACPPDPRPTCPSPEETGRGPLPASWGKFLRLELSDKGPCLVYTVGTATVKETWFGATRRLEISGPPGFLSFADSQGKVVSLAVSEKPLVREISYGQPISPPRKMLDLSGTVTTAAQLGAAQAGFHVDVLELPTDNRWRRNVRPSSIDFFPNGRAAICTFDGDVWLVDGCEGNLAKLQWKRFATGLHEPQSIQIVGQDIYVFTKQGVEKLKASPDGTQAVAHELFCDQFPQSADTREFPMDMVKRPEGGFFVAKGGQQLSRKGLSAGRIYAISKEGQAQEYARGLRQAYLGMNAQTGLLTATDQQGHWVPSSPIYEIKQGGYYGYPEASIGPEPATPLAASLSIPHEVNQSAAGQAWCLDSRMGELNGALVHLGYFKSAMFKIMLGKTQSSAIPLGLNFPIPLLKAAMNPRDGLLYACGLQVWGTDAPKISGIIRLRPQEKAEPRLPKQITAFRQGILLEFPTPLATADLKAENFTIASWDYLRSKNYGSPPISKTGKPGMDETPLTAVQVGTDQRTLFLQTPELTPRQTIRVDYQVKSAAGLEISNFAVITAATLADFSPPQQHFTVKNSILASALRPTKEKMVGTAAEGRKLVELLGCLACHSTDGKMEGMKGPSWKGLLGSEVELVKGGDRATVDRAYLEESVLHPPNKVRKGFDNPDIGMPSYEGILTDSKLESVLLYLESLR